uniref:Uncharacterized protein n=1 Tax=Arundo donax TaxID=35708 RepID=A0A0A9B001_ARUDO
MCQRRLLPGRGRGSRWRACGGLGGWCRTHWSSMASTAADVEAGGSGAPPSCAGDTAVFL